MSAKTRIRVIARRVLRPGDSALVDKLPMYLNSVGTLRDRATSAIRTANRVFPLLTDLVSGTGGAIEKPMSVEFCPDDEPKQQAAAELKKLFDRYGSDKATFHDYHLLYGSILVERETVTTMLEIGIGTHYPDVVSTMGAPGKPGASLRAFRDFLPNATIYGADVDKRILFAEDRIRTFFVDQTDRCSFEQLTANFDGAEFDLIIDDGLHSPDANIETLLFGLGRLKVGGSFVVEDIAPSAEPIWQVVGALLPEKYEHHVISAKNGMLFWIRRAAR